MSELRHVRAMFHVLNQTEGIGYRTIRLAPTYATRDGVQVPEHKAFWDATPSGNMEVTVAPDAESVEFFEPGRYVYLDFYAKDYTPPAPSTGRRSSWWVASVKVDGRPPGTDYGTSFHVSLAPPRGESVQVDGKHSHWDNGQHAWLFGKGYAKGEIGATIQNPHAFPFFALEPGQTRELVVDFWPVP